MRSAPDIINKLLLKGGNARTKHEGLLKNARAKHEGLLKGGSARTKHEVTQSGTGVRLKLKFILKRR